MRRWYATRRLVTGSHVGEAAHHVVARVRPALIFLYDGDAIGVVAVGAEPARLAQGDPEVVAQLRAWQAFGMILVKQRRPVAGEIGLRRGGSGVREHSDEYCGGRRGGAQPGH
jgi:hypothetical protein